MYQPGLESYPEYYRPYVALALGGELNEQLQTQKQLLIDIFKDIEPSKGDYKYAEEKWSIKDVLLHLIDTERIFAYRVLKIIRGEGADLKSFDQNTFVVHANAQKSQLSDLIRQYSINRDNTLALFQNVDEEGLNKTGSVDENTISAGALGFIILGHEQHHLNVLKERYL